MTDNPAPKNESGVPLKRRALSIEETAQTLGISHWTVRRLVKSGALRSCRVLRTHLIPVDEIDRLLGNLPSKK